MGLLSRTTDLITGNSEAGRIVDRQAPGAKGSQRSALVKHARGAMEFTGAMQRFANGSYASDFNGRANRARFANTTAPVAMARDVSYLRAEGRRVSMFDPHAVQSIRILSRWTVGSGFNMTVTANNKRNQKIVDKAVDDWFRTSMCDANRHGNFYEMTHLAYTTVKAAGECLVRLRPRFASDGLPVPLAIEVIQPDYFYDGSQPSIDSGNTYAAGIESSPVGHPVAYWLYRGHPGDNLPNRTPVRVPVIDPITKMRQIVHLFDRDFPGQLRGIPRACLAVNTIYEQQDLRMSLLMRKRIEAKVNYWLKSKSSDPGEAPNFGPTRVDGTLVDDAQFIYDNEFGDSIGSVPPGDVPLQPRDAYAFSDYVQQLISDGGVVPLPVDYDVTETSMSTSTDYAPFMKEILETIATAFGVPYALMSADLSQGNYSSTKAGMLQFQRERTAEQEYWKSEFCQFVFQGFAIAGERKGLWQAKDISCHFRADAFPSMEPAKEIAVTILKLQNGLISPRRAAAELGEDFDIIMEECAEDFAKLKAVGIDVTGILKAEATAGAVNPPADENGPLPAPPKTPKKATK